MGKTWEINPKIALWMYKAILLPKLLYAAIVWWPMVSKVEKGTCCDAYRATI
jgi:hypothetical protein